MTRFKRNDAVVRLTTLDETMKAGDVHIVREVDGRGGLTLFGQMGTYDPDEFRLATDDEINKALKP